ncbi:MAG: FG-GAP-like repeat-containing protein [bacterium]
MFDGTILEVGGLPSGTMFPYYDVDYGTRAAIASPLVMSGVFSVINDQAEASFDITVDAAISGAHTVHFFVCIDGLHGQSNMVVMMPATEPFTLTTPAQTTTVTRTFTMDPSWNVDDLRIIALVQKNTTKEILQAASAIPDYASTVAIDCDPDGVEAGWLLEGPDGISIRGSGDTSLNLFRFGQFTLTWDEIPWWTGPAVNPQVLTVAEDGAITFTGAYSDGPFQPLTAGAVGDPGPGRGVSLVDVDGDGDLDVHVINQGGVDQLLRNDGNETFTDIAAGPLADPGAGVSGAWADFNGDGHLDVYLARDGEASVLLAGDGSGGFAVDPAYGVNVTVPAAGASWFDFRQDGDLDLFILNHGAANTVLENIGDPGVGYTLFVPVVGTPLNNLGNSSAHCWNDGNLDGRMDLYLARKFNANVYLENTVLGFQDVSGSSNTNDNSNSYGAAWGDYDNDGDFDLYVANGGNADRLYRCTGPFQYSLNPGANLGDTGQGRGVAWADLDNDGFLDLYVTRSGQSDLMLINDGAGGFTRIPVGPAEADGASNAVGCGDLDGDGRLDVFITKDGQPNVLLVNQVANANHWLQLALTGNAPNTSAIGARIVVSTGGVSRSRLVVSGSGYLSNSPLVQHFGLGDAGLVDQVEIFWPDGTIQSFGPIAADRTVAVIQGQDPVSAVGDRTPRAAALGQAHPNPFNPSTTIGFELAAPGPVRLAVYALDGRLVATLAEGPHAAGPHAVTWRGEDDGGRPVASGSYLYRLETGDGSVRTGRMTMVK